MIRLPNFTYHLLYIRIGIWSRSSWENAILKKFNIKDDKLWFNGKIDVLKEEGFRKIKSQYPNAIIQCPTNFLSPIVLATPKKAKDYLEMHQEWGINRFSVSWKSKHKHKISLIEHLDKWNFEFNIYNVYGLHEFLQAVVQLPTSITSDFNFPKWNYFGEESAKKDISSISEFQMLTIRE